MRQTSLIFILKRNFTYWYILWFLICAFNTFVFSCLEWYHLSLCGIILHGAPKRGNSLGRVADATNFHISQVVPFQMNFVLFSTVFYVVYFVTRKCFYPLAVLILMWLLGMKGRFLWIKSMWWMNVWVDLYDANKRQYKSINLVLLTYLLTRLIGKIHMRDDSDVWCAQGR